MFLYLLALVVLGALGYLTGRFINWMTVLDEECENGVAVSLENPESLDKVPLPSIFAPASKALSVIIPAYNEEERISSTLTEIISYLRSRRVKQGAGFTYEVIVVDDGSKDNTRGVVLDFSKRHGFDTVRLLRVAKNRGKGHAVKRGMLVARGAFLLMADADGATRFADIERLEAQLDAILVKDFGSKTPLGPNAPSSAAGTAGPVGAAFGSRSHLQREAVVKRSAVRNFLMKGFHLLVLFVAGGKVKDTQCGFKLFSRRAAAVLFSNQRLHRWCFDVEILHLCRTLGVPVAEVHVNWTEVPGSKLRFTSVVHMALELVLLKTAYQICGTWRILSELELKKRAD